MSQEESLSHAARLGPAYLVITSSKNDTIIVRDMRVQAHDRPGQGGLGSSQKDDNNVLDQQQRHTGHADAELGSSMLIIPTAMYDATCVEHQQQNLSPTTLDAPPPVARPRQPFKAATLAHDTAPPHAHATPAPLTEDHVDVSHPDAADARALSGESLASLAPLRPPTGFFDEPAVTEGRAQSGYTPDTVIYSLPQSPRQSAAPPTEDIYNLPQTSPRPSVAISDPRGVYYVPQDAQIRSSVALASPRSMYDVPQDAQVRASVAVADPRVAEVPTAADIVASSSTEPAASTTVRGHV